MVREKKEEQSDRRVARVQGMDERKMAVVVASHALGNSRNMRPDLVASGGKKKKFDGDNAAMDVERDRVEEEEDLGFEVPAEDGVGGREGVVLEDFTRVKEQREELKTGKKEAKASGVDAGPKKEKSISIDAQKAAREFTLRYLEEEPDSPTEEPLPERIEQSGLQSEKWNASIVNEDDSEDSESEDGLPGEMLAWEKEVRLEFRNKQANDKEDIMLHGLWRNDQKIAALEYESAVAMLLKD